MNRHERRAAAANQRKWKDGTRKLGVPIKTQSFLASDGLLYWFEEPEGFTRENGLPSGVEIYGPFKTDAEVQESQRLVLVGPQCTLTHAGAWDPAWDRPQ